MSASLPSEPSSRTSSQVRKLDLAHRARLMQDNHQVLALTLADNRVLRDQARRHTEAQMAQTPPPPTPEEPMGDINIDSPTTIHNHYPASPATPAGPPAAAPPVSPASSSGAPAPAAAVTAVERAVVKQLPRWVPWLGAAGLALATGGVGAGVVTLIAGAPKALAPAATHVEIQQPSTQPVPATALGKAQHRHIWMDTSREPWQLRSSAREE